LALSGADAPLRQPRPKVRSRRDGAAVPLDEDDKRLMNLLQSSFGLEAEPFAVIARELELPLDEVLAAGGDNLDDRERAALHEELEASVAEARAGQLVDADEVLRALRDKR